MRLRDVLEQPGSRLPVLVGAGELDRPLTLAYTTDLLDPTRYLTGGEVVLTGMMWRREPADSELFVSRLAHAGVAALGAGEGGHGPVPADLVQACARHGLPLFAVPAEVSFREVTDRISAVLWAEREADAVAARGRQRGLVASLAAGADLAEVWPATGAWLLSSTGRVVTGPPLDPTAATETGGARATGAAGLGPRLAREFLRAATLPVRCAAGGREFHLDAVPPGERPLGQFVAVEGDPTPVENLVALAALDAARHDRARRLEHRLAGQLVATLRTGAARAEVAAALRACGLPDTGPHTVLAAVVAGAEAAALLAELLQPAPAVVCADGERAVAVVAGAEPALRDQARHLVSAVRGLRLTAGISEAATDLAGLPAALAQAEHALTYAARRPGRVRVVGSAELASHELLLASVPRQVREAFAQRLLSPLSEYDRTHRADLVHTLRTFLDCDGSWTRCAAALHLHVNTLRYRIGRIGALTGRDLDHFPDRVDLYLALRATT
ncbi:PucR family transcriptional regulator [Catellatospora tritici]|uniref:PucR family transcriptional regulator n=1 Tax=Catellatospora tritici TaxID=2851566 RepID=UPI001C2CEF8C|nr:PucR family transcriptional regulator [Catellatospora tritici]MBV1854711.1 PucR family transcriptional regulator ligand-binding domain-containing protein [Catellatospora tritici]